MDKSLAKDENFMVDASALVERAKIEVPSFDDPLVFGFRKNGALSILFGPQAVYHFNCHNELRTIFIGGKRYKAQQGCLVRVDRKPIAPSVQLQITKLPLEKVADLLGDMHHRLAALGPLLDAKQYRILGQIPEQADTVSRLRSRIPRLLKNRIASAPNANA